jgi:uncharacterized membrane protein YhhN
MNSALLYLAAFCALTYLPLTANPAGWLRSLIKTSAVACLAIASLVGGPVLLTVALAFCALGDLCLSRDGDRAFMLGIAAFACGHLAYIALFLSAPDGVLSQAVSGSRMVVTVGLIITGVLMARVLALRAGDLRIPVLLYIPIILGMGVAALTLPMPLVLLSATAFIVSDLILAAEVFLLPEGHKARRIAPYLIWLLYWGAQVGFFGAFA